MSDDGRCERCGGYIAGRSRGVHRSCMRVPTAMRATLDELGGTVAALAAASGLSTRTVLRVLAGRRVAAETMLAVRIGLRVMAGKGEVE